jgi:biopolymer transport protein ExbD
MKRKTFLDSIDVPNPCDKNWDSMTGDNQIRLCSHCDTNIHNLSEMSAKNVKNLLFQNKGRVCVRLTRDADGKVQTNDRKFHQIKRNTRIVASFLSITLALTTVPFAQSAITANSIENQSKTQQNLLTLTITDSNKALIPNAQVKIINLETKIAQIGRSNENGELQFVIEKLGNYEIVVGGIAGFKELKKTVELTKENLKMTLQLEAKATSEIGVVGGDAREVEIGTTQSTIATSITGRPLELLPIANRTFTTLLGLIPETKEQRKLRQKTSQISFTIFDSNGAVIPNAEVKLTNDKTKKEFIVNTNSQGIAYFLFLPHGRYQVKTSAEYFRSSVMSVIVKEESEPNIEMTLDVNSSTFTGVVVFNWSEIPIFNSISQNDVEVIKNYIALGKNVNLKIKSNGKTMLHVAVESDNLEIVKLLIDAGASINAKDKIGRTPIMLIDLSEENSSGIIKLLIGKGANLNIQNKDEDNQTLLMSACDDDNLEIVKLLLESGANPNLKDNDGETAMMKTTSEEIKSLLKKYGAKK